MPRPRGPNSLLRLPTEGNRVFGIRRRVGVGVGECDLGGEAGRSLSLSLPEAVGWSLLTGAAAGAEGSTLKGLAWADGREGGE